MTGKKLTCGSGIPPSRGRTDNTLLSILRSWHKKSGLSTITELLGWINQRNMETGVDIRKITLEDCKPWYYDAGEGCIRNQERTFFTIVGCKGPNISQPIILQEEIGFLGILCRKFDGVMHFLMQAKIEPGNINCVQISPTIQATKSNFTQKHGGKRPAYLEYFLNAGNYEIVVDQVQSEQSSRFFKKRNRNSIVHVEEDIPILPTHRWMTLGQIKMLMRYDNLVNMDTRTVLSCIPFSKLSPISDGIPKWEAGFQDMALLRSLFVGGRENLLPQVYQHINNQKMFAEVPLSLVPLHQLEDWEMRGGEFVCNRPYPFKVVFCDITIEGREVTHWAQPLVEAMGIATFGLICCEDDGLLKFVVRATPEVGCFDSLELGPTVQQEAVGCVQQEDEMACFFWGCLKSGQGVIFDHLLSEEGGRFYHEQNRNVLIRIQKSELPPLPAGYFLLDYRTLNELVQVNNTMNIQLRNLLSLLEV